METKIIIVTIFTLIQLSFGQDTCQSWRQNYYTYCTQNPRPQQYQSSCTLYESTCMSGGSSSGFQTQNGNANANGNGVNTQTSSQTTGGGNIKQTWDTLTDGAMYQQTQDALKNAQNGQADCGQYSQHYNVWCGGIKPINPTYCSMMQQVCVTQAQQWASGQAPSNGNAFNSGNGMPTGGAGSTRPLTVGSNLGVGPFFGMGKTLGINPLQGVGTNQNFQVPIAGIGVNMGKSVDYGGLLGVAQLGQLVGGGGRKRRWAIPVGVDQYGNQLYVLH